MTRNVGTSIENNFTRGLVTEVTGVNSPENSVTSSINVVYDRRGKASKRKAFDFEVDHELNPISSSGVHLEYVWETVSDNSSVDFVVTQVGSKIYFYESSGSNPLSASRQSFSIDLLTYKTPTFSDATVEQNYCSFSSGRGYLFVAHPNCETIYVEYISSSSSILARPITIKIRDLEGISDGLDLNTRPVVLSNAHKYNLYNQGWYTTAQSGFTGNIAPVQVLDFWRGVRGDSPSNNDVWWYYTKISQSGGAAGQEAFDPQLVDLKSGFFGNTPAPKGHYIIDALQTNRSTLSGISGLTESSSDGLRPSVVSFYAGRAFYTGVGKSGFSQTIYFSQIIERDEQLGFCYQSNDPSSRDNADLLDSDGGTIEIQDINTIYDLRVVGQSLIVFASNGVWSISGTDNGSFRATDYTVSKISAFPAINKTTIVVVSGTPVWWNYEGIYTLKTSEVGLTNEVTSLTVSTIQSFYDLIPQSSKFYSKGVYNNQTNLVYWLYSSTDSAQDYTNILVMDAVSGAFYPLSLPETGPKLVGLLSVRTSQRLDVDDQVIVSGPSDVTTNLGSLVHVSVFDGYQIGQRTFKFLTDDGTNLSFAEMVSESYLDWGIEGYPAEFVTGYRVRGELLKKSQTNYLTVVTEDQEGSSCYIQPIWDYSNDHDSGRFGNPQQVYRTRSFKDYQRSKIKIRGNGFSLQFKFYGLVGLPFTIVGWAGFESTTGVP